MRKLTITCLMVFLSSCKFAEKEKYIFPANYTGNIYIFSNVKNGAPKQYDDSNNRIYLVSQTGILISQFKETYGVINKTYFFETAKGKQIEIDGIPFQDDKTSLDNNKIYAFYGNDVTITFPKAKDTVEVQIVTICKPNQLDIANNEPFMKIILGSHLSPENITYQKLIDMRSKSNRKEEKKN